ncbi:hypothetical protein PR202_ga15254 [Eleusine coracana subsp. coracana]|uniref:Uncharacterized protein n=1 Tax=Eleusine coracana subsp. coracana TaxID=191504 RepID=A0AAV5CJF0_ELECO|nr:hypothetical protein PR202_ga15254 [Eleusine coracana subsp. coracana]
MDLVASEDEDQGIENMEMGEEWMTELPDSIVEQIIKARIETEGIDQVTEDLSKMGGENGLPEEWLYKEKEQNQQEQKDNNESIEDGGNKVIRGKKKKAPVQGWGPVKAKRKSTRTRTGKGNIMQKAQALKMINNLEIKQDKKNDFRTLLNKDRLVSVARTIGIDFNKDDKDGEV